MTEEDIRKVADPLTCKDVLLRKLGLPAAELLVCKQRPLNYTGHVNYCDLSVFQEINHFLQSSAMFIL